MNFIKLFFTVFLLLTLTGCTLFGWYENGNPYPGYNVDDLSDWKSFRFSDDNHKKDDWISCGGTRGGMVKHSDIRPGLSHSDRIIELEKENNAAQKCMANKGYKFIGDCRGPLGGSYACRNKRIFIR